MQFGRLNRALARPLSRQVRVMHIAGPILLVALLALIQIVGLSESYEQSRIRAELSAQNIGSVMAESIAGTFRNIDLTLQDAIADFNSQSRPPTADRSTFDVRLEKLRQRVPSLVSLRVTDAMGEVRYGTEPIREINVSDRDYFQSLKNNDSENLVISPPLMGRIIKKWILICARRYNLPNGEFGGIVYGSIEIEGMPERLSGRRIKLADQDLFTVVDNDANLIARYVHGKQDMQFVGKKISSSNLANFLKSGAETDVFSSVSPIDQIERITYYQRIAGNSLVLIVGMNTDDAFSGWRREALFTGITTVIFSILVFTGSYLLYGLHQQKLKTVRELDDALNINRLVIGNSPVGIQAFHANGQCMLANQAVAVMVGGTQEDLLKQNFRDLESWKKSGAVDVADRALATGQTCRFEADIVTSFGKALRLEWIFTPFISHGESKLMTILRDCTEVHRAREALVESNRRLTALCSTDSLTDVLNRRGFDEALVKEWRRAVRDRKPLALTMIDVDFFKQYNDHYGHQKGDESLLAVARILSQHILRAGDVIARYGGEEFAFIGPATSIDDALHVMERIRAALENLALPHALSPFGCVTVSIGVAALIPDEGYTPKALIRSADEALYRAKADGRNRVAIATGIKKRA